MIASFKHKGLNQLWSINRTSRIDARLHRRIVLRLDALDAATVPEDMDHPGYDFHALRGFNPVRYTVHVNGPWCITFSFEDGNAVQVDFEQYH